MWTSIEISKNKIEKDTGKATLINLPNKSNYKGYSFWHPSKLVRSKGCNFTFSFNDSFEFKIFKNGKGKYNKFDKLDEITICASEIIEEFEVINDNLVTCNAFLEVIEPTKIKKDVKVLEELCN